MSDVAKGSLTLLVFSVLVFVPVLYFIANLFFALHCVSVLSNSESSSICRVSRTFEYLDNVIPAIWRGVNVFEQAGNFRQARVVRGIYEFFWGTAIICFLFMLAVSLGWLAIRGQESRQRASRYYREKFGTIETKSKKTYKIALIYFCSVFVSFFSALYGDPAFNNIGSYAAKVYVREVDFLWPLLQLVLVLCGVLFGVVIYVRAVALKHAD